MVAVAKETVRNGDSYEEKVKKLPVSGEKRLVDEFRSLGREKWKDDYEDGNDEGFVEKMMIKVRRVLFDWFNNIKFVVFHGGDRSYR